MAQPEYFPERRNLEDLWQAAFPVGTEWSNIDRLREFNWNFSNLEQALEEGGALYGQKVYLFSCTEAPLLEVNGEHRLTLVPVVVAVVSPFPPSDKIAIKSLQRAEDIMPMKAMKMAWVPYIPLENRQRQVDRLNTQIYTMGCTLRRSALKHLKIERVKQYDYCLPYFPPLNLDEDDEDTIVTIMYPLEPPVVCDFDWRFDDLEEFVNDLIKVEELPEDQKERFKEHVQDVIRKKQQARESIVKAREELDPETIAAYENMRFFKFYPVQTPDTPDISEVKVRFINRYYGQAHFMM